MSYKQFHPPGGIKIAYVAISIAMAMAKTKTMKAQKTTLLGIVLMAVLLAVSSCTKETNTPTPIDNMQPYNPAANRNTIPVQPILDPTLQR